MKVSLIGQRDLEVEKPLKPQRDYGLFLIASLLSTEEFVDEDIDKVKYKLKISHIQQITDLKEKKNVEFKKGKTSSQRMRWRVEEKLGLEEYDNFMSYLQTRLEELTDDYIDNLQK